MLLDVSVWAVELFRVAGFYLLDVDLNKDLSPLLPNLTLREVYGLHLTGELGVEQGVCTRDHTACDLRGFVMTAHNKPCDSAWPPFP